MSLWNYDVYYTVAVQYLGRKCKQNILRIVLDSDNMEFILGLEIT